MKLERKKKQKPGHESLGGRARLGLFQDQVSSFLKIKLIDNTSKLIICLPVLILRPHRYTPSFTPLILKRMMS